VVRWEYACWYGGREVAYFRDQAVQMEQPMAKRSGLFPGIDYPETVAYLGQEGWEAFALEGKTWYFKRPIAQD